MTNGRHCSADDCPYSGEPEKERRGWHLERRIGLDVIISFLFLFLAGLGYVVRQDTRVTKVEDRATTLEAADVRIEGVQKTQRDEVRTDLKDINSKLDRLIERRP